MVSFLSERYDGRISHKGLRMKKSQVIEFYGGVRAAARALCLGASTVCEWKEDVPASRQQHVRLAMESETRRRNKVAAKEAKKKAGEGRKRAA